MARHTRRSRSFFALCILVLVGAGAYWYGSRAGWFIRATPSRLPTADELERMAEIDRSSARIAPNAIPGAGVRPKGSLPPRTDPSEGAATSTVTPTTATSTAP